LLRSMYTYIYTYTHGKKLRVTRKKLRVTRKKLRVTRKKLRVTQ
jgi:hypothetical protein